MDYRIEITGTDGIFLRAAQGTVQTISPINNEGVMKIVDGTEKQFSSHSKKRN